MENSFYVTPVLVMIRPIPISDSLRNGFPFDACVCAITRARARARARLRTRARAFLRTRMRVHKGATGLSRRLIYRRARYRPTICQRAVSPLIETQSRTTVIERRAASRSRPPPKSRWRFINVADWNYPRHLAPYLSSVSLALHTARQGGMR